jgi:DNA-binding response OmpR family regulator
LKITNPLLALRQGLEEEGYSVDWAADGADADVKARSTSYDVIVLDVMLPHVDGLTLLQNWRKDGLEIYVLILTARSTVDDKVKGLDSGADDYLTKPFELGRIASSFTSTYPTGASGQRSSDSCFRPGN